MEYTFTLLDPSRPVDKKWSDFFREGHWRIAAMCALPDGRIYIAWGREVMT
jgi:hypothetical protein